MKSPSHFFASALILPIPSTKFPFFLFSISLSPSRRPSRNCNQPCLSTDATKQHVSTRPENSRFCTYESLEFPKIQSNFPIHQHTTTPHNFINSYPQSYYTIRTIKPSLTSSYPKNQNLMEPFNLKHDSACLHPQIVIHKHPNTNKITTFSQSHIHGSILKCQHITNGIKRQKTVTHTMHHLVVMFHRQAIQDRARKTG